MALTKTQLTVAGLVVAVVTRVPAPGSTRCARLIATTRQCPVPVPPGRCRYETGTTRIPLTEAQVTDVTPQHIRRGPAIPWADVLRRRGPRLGRPQSDRCRGCRRGRVSGGGRCRSRRCLRAGGAAALRCGRLPGRLRRAAGGGQPHRPAAGGGRTESRLPTIRGRRVSGQHRKARVCRRSTRRPAGPPTGAGYGSSFVRHAAGHRGLSAPGYGGAVSATPRAEVQGQAGTQR